MDTHQKIDINKIREPEIAMRSKFDEKNLEDLASSIKEVGLIQPITVRKDGDEYEIIAGHRRYLAARRADLPRIQAIIKEIGDEDLETVKLHENSYREDVNPVDEGRYIARVVQKTDKDIPDIADLMGRSEKWVRGRLEIVNYDDDIVEALYHDAISLGVAGELQKIENDTQRHMHLEYALKDGVSVARARAWRQSANSGRAAQSLEEAQDIEPAESSVGKKRMIRCALTDEEIPMEDSVTVVVDQDYFEKLKARM